MQEAIDKRETSHLEVFSKYKMTKKSKIFDSYYVHLLLLNNEYSLAITILQKYPFEALNDKSFSFHYLYGCYLTQTEGIDIAQIHFSSMVDTLFYPPTRSLLSHYVMNKIDDKKSSWYKKAFFFEKRELFRQLSLFYHCNNDKKNEKKYLKLLSKT